MFSLTEMLLLYVGCPLFVYGVMLFRRSAVQEEDNG